METWRWGVGGGGLEAGCFLCLTRLRAKEEKASFHKEKYFLNFFLFLPLWNRLEICSSEGFAALNIAEK